MLTWNRTNKVVSEPFIYAYSTNTGYGKKLRKYGMIGFLNFIRKNLQDTKTIIHVIDFSMLMLLLFIKKPRAIIYEVYDIKFLKRQVLNNIRENRMFIINRKVDAIILASPYFKVYYKQKLRFAVI